jgi:hypothetical protein
VALFSHSHFGRVLAARWIGLPVAQAQHLLLNTASVSVLCYEHERTDQPAIALWNSVAAESLAPATEADDGERSVLKQRAIQRWENEGGEIPNVPIRQTAAMSAVRSPGKKLFIFDLDGTLAESKAPLDAEMAALLKALLGQVKVAVISGGDWPQFESQLLANLSPDANLKNLSLLPTCGTKFYQFDSDWQQLYAEDFTKAEKENTVKEAGVVSIQVNNAEETKRVIETFLASGAGIEPAARGEEVAR